MGRLIALSGVAGSGKDTVASLISAAVADSGRFSFAGPLKEIAQQVYSIPHDYLYGPSELRAMPIAGRRKPSGEPLLVRDVLQTLGMWGRLNDESTWSRLGVQQATEWLDEEPEGVAILTDCRFVNEAEEVLAAGGEVWRISRPGAGLKGPLAMHPSETEQQSAEFRALVSVDIQNDGTLEDLRRAVTTLINRSQVSSGLRTQ